MYAQSFYWLLAFFMSNCITMYTGTFVIMLSIKRSIETKISILCFSANSTETFWESGDEDRNKTKSITITCNSSHHPKMVYAHIDNSRDLGVSIILL